MDITGYNPAKRAIGRRRNQVRFFSDDTAGWPFDLGEADHWHVVDHWHPAVDISETEDSLHLRAEIPGMDKKEIKIEIKDHTLTMSGERKFLNGDSKERFRKVERAYGRFFRSIDLPEGVKQDEIKASYTNGILDIRIPKSEAIMPKEIPVEVE